MWRQFICVERSRKQPPMFGVVRRGSGGCSRDLRLRLRAGGCACVSSWEELACWTWVAWEESWVEEACEEGRDWDP